MSIVEFLNARITEDETAANKAAKSVNTRWMHSEEEPAGAEWESWDGMVRGSTGYDLWDCEGSTTLTMDSDAADHIALHDPARALAECKAKRRLIKRAYAIDDGTWGRRNQADGLLQTLAAVYADHPDYREEQEWEIWTD